MPRLKILGWLMIALGAVYAFSVFLLLYLTTTPDVTQDKDAAEAIHGMRIGAVSCAVLAIPTLISGFKLFQRRRWAYWLAVANLGISTAALATGTVINFRVEWDSFWVFLVFLALFIFAVLPVTRRELNPQPSAPPAVKGI
jgi:hypothetical protein